ncbi:MAG: PQQ-binding-like beta-propeller repeat protein, partial [Candidatus Zixiibacteriota bacterium]
ASYCSLKTVNLGFDASGSVGAPGAEVYIWSSDGTYPTSVITTYIINPVSAYFPTFTSINVAPANIIITGDYHVGYTTIQNTPTDVLAILSDDGNSGSGRSGEFYLGNWWLMANSWGVDVDFLINVDVCCLPPGYCPITCSATDQWPTFSHDYARTGQSQLSLGDLCGIVSAWSFVGTGASNFSSPVISNDLVLCAHDDRIQAVDLLTGALVWDTKAGALAAQYALVINTGLRTQITIDGGSVYFATGGLRGFAKADLLTGNHIWSRGIGVGNPLPGVPGLTTYGGNIVRGNEVFFGDANGQIYSLNATTGADNYFAQILTSNALKGSITGAPSTDGSQLFFANAANLASATSGIGGIHSVTPGGSFTSNWDFESPNISVLHEAFASAPAFRCTNLFIHATFSNSVPASGFSGYRQNLDPATGIPNWASYFLQGQNSFGGNTAVDGSQAYFASLNNGFSGPSGSRGVRAVNFANSTVWARGGTAGAYDENVFQSIAVTCDPYLVYGTYDLLNGDSHWRIVDGMTGTALVDYYLTAGMVNGTAIAKGSDAQTYLVFSTRFTNFSAGPGGLFAFKNGGPRPRMSIPEAVVAFTGTNTSEVAPVQRTDVDAVLNVGCATLNVTATLEAGNPPSAMRRITDVNPSLAVKAQSLASSLIDYSIYDMVERAAVSMKGMDGSIELMDADGEIISQAAMLRDVKPARANSEALAPPSWVDWILPASGGATANFAVAAGLGQNFTFEFDRSGMNFLAPNNFYVYIDSDDPDYNLEDPLASPQAIIEYSIPYEYCPKDTGRMAFGTTGGEWYTNFGRLADGSVSFEFTLDGSTDGSITYSGGMWFMTSMDDAAWNPDASSVPAGFGFLFPFYVGLFADGDCGGCDFGVNLPVEYTTDNGVSYANTIGDLCTFAMIDSLQGAGLWPHQSGPTIGLLINYREVGTYGADFGDFKLIVVDMNNRNAAAVNGLYYGNIEDFDPIDAGYGDPSKGYIYQSDGAGKVRGFIGLPLNGSYWPDGTKTDPMYNARTIENGEVVYPSAACPECILDSLYAFVDGLPEGAYDLMPDGALGPDKSTIAAFGKVDLAPNGSHSYGFAIYGLEGSANQNGDTEALSKFVNKYAGFARGDVNNDDVIDLRDLVRLSRFVAALPGSLGPAPFKHLGDVNNDGAVDSADCSYLAAYYFTGGAPPKSAFMF